MVVLFSAAAAARRRPLRLGLRRCCWPRRAAGQRGLQVGLGDPEVAQRFDVAGDARHLLAGIGEQFEDADEHAVVAKQVLSEMRFLSGTTSSR